VQGLDATATTPIYMSFRNGSGGYITRAITGPLSITIPAAATMGAAANNWAIRVWLAAFDDGGTVRLAVYNATYSSGGTTAVRGPDDAQPTSSVQPPGNNAFQIYTGSVAVTNRFWKWIGYANYEAGLAAMGNWNVSPNIIEVMQPGTPKPGQVIYQYYNGLSTSDNLSTTTTTAIGTALTQAAQSACNLWRYRVDGYIYLRTAAANGQGIVLLTRDASNINNTGANAYSGAATDLITPFSLTVVDKPGTPGNHTYRPYAHNATAALVNYATYNNVLEEIMG
jgi:hypothetical protein